MPLYSDYSEVYNEAGKSPTIQSITTFQYIWNTKFDGFISYSSYGVNSYFSLNSYYGWF